MQKPVEETIPRMLVAVLCLGAGLASAASLLYCLLT